MTNDEIRKNGQARLSKQPARARAPFRHLHLGFLLSFVIHHSSLTALALAVSCSKPTASGLNQGPDDALPITVARVDLVPMEQSLDVWGTLYAKDEATLGAEVEGKVEKT